MIELSNALTNNTVTLIPDTRIIYLNGPIDPQTAFHFNIMLLALESQSNEEDITVYINSPGGSVSDGLSMIDTMKLIKCDVATVCVGMAASMGALLLMSGKKGKRSILPHSSVLIHQPLGNVGNSYLQASDIEIIARDVATTKRMVYEIISEATGQSYEKVARDCDRDYTLHATEAVKYGIVDKVVESH